jgi:ABC-type proline/glycine betaine transport system permease subunit
VVHDLFDGLTNFLRAIPTTAWVPFTVFFFGIHESAAIFLIAFGAFFPIAMNVAAGARQTPRTLIRAALMLGTPPRNLLWRVVLPATLPSVFAGLRIGLGLAWVLVIVSEMLAVQGGLGYALWSAYQVNRLDLIVDAIISVGLLGLVSDWLLVQFAGMSLRWRIDRTMSDRMSDRPLIECRGLTKVFRDIHRGETVVACQDVSLDIRHGEFITVIGPSGCGKTSLLYILAASKAKAPGRSWSTASRSKGRGRTARWCSRNTPCFPG